MKRKIKTEGVDPGSLSYNHSGIAVKELLCGEIAGAITRHVLVKPDCTYQSVPGETFRILFFIKGSGEVKSSKQTFRINEMAVFVPAYQEPYSVISRDGTEFLEVLYKKDERDEITEWLNKPHFLEYSKCNTYLEAIKSEKTINRTIIDVYRIPRFCMGSVETRGKDIVGEHSHPMVDQLFFGLPGNSCLVKADNEEAYFGGNTLLHIPPGSMHGVTVEHGHLLHYLWLDFFKDNDMSYIKDSHLIEGE